jgi:ABC-type transport system substrate-binding protein
MKSVKYIFAMLMVFYTLTSQAKTIKIFMGGESYAPYDIRVSSSVYGTSNTAIFGFLLKSNDIQEINPGLIHQWNYDYRKKKYFLTVGNEKFHNGREINAKDLEFSIVRGFVSNIKNYHKIYFSDIVGTENLKPGMKFVSGMLSGLKVINDKTIEISLKAVNPSFLLHFASPLITLVPQEELKDDYFSWKKYPIGAGAYKVDNDYRNDVLVLKKVEPTIAKADVVELHTSPKVAEYDLLFDRSDKFKMKGVYKTVYSKYPTSISTLFFYRNNRLGKDLNFRKAIYYGIDRAGVAKGFDQFQPAYELVLPPYTCRKQNNNYYDFEKAKKYINQVPKDLLKSEIVIGVYTDLVIAPALKTRLNRISADLKKLGLNVVFKSNTEQYPTAEVINKYSMKLWSKNVDLDDPAIVFGSMTSLSPFKDEVPDTNGKFDRLYNEVVSQSSIESRFKKIREISSYVDDQSLAIPLLQRYPSYVLNVKTVKDLGAQSKPLYLDISLIELL